MNHIEPRICTEHQYRQMRMLSAWATLLDIHNAIVYGFVQYRLPEPGKPIDVAEAEAHVAHIEKEWEAESQRRDLDHQWTGAPPFSKMPLNAKLYLHSVLLEVRSGELGSPKRNFQPPAQEEVLYLHRMIDRWVDRGAERFTGDEIQIQ